MKIKLTKKELQEYLAELQALAIRKVSKKLKYNSISKIYLQDLSLFLEILEQIPKSKTFNVILQSSKLFKNKKVYKIIFDSPSILLLQDGELYIYIIAKYKLQ